MRQLAVLGVLLCTVGLFVGCGPSGPARCEVSGEVRFEGAPIEDGVITFLPQDGQASMDGANIAKGAYRIPRAKGLFPGKYKVSIVAGDGLSGAGDAGATPRQRKAPPPGFKQGLERIPAEWNTQTQQVVDVKAEGPNKFDFHIPKS